MPTAKPTTVAAYLKSLPADRRDAIEAVRAAINKALPKGYEEGIQYGMIGYYVPHSVYPPGYHCDPSQPLPFIGLASQKNHMALYMFCLYSDEGALAVFTGEWEATGLRLDMGKSCVRFKKLEDVPLPVVARAVKRATVRTFVASYEASLEAAGTVHKGKKKLAKKTAKKTAKKSTKETTKKPASKKTTTKKAPTKKAAAKKRATTKRATTKRTTKKR